MSWTDDELSDMARKAEANQAFAYQDSFWEEMEAMLPAKKKRFWPFFLAIVLPLVGVAAFFVGISETELKTANAAKTLNINGYEKDKSRIDLAKFTALSSLSSATKNRPFKSNSVQIVRFDETNIRTNKTAKTPETAPIIPHLSRTSRSSIQIENEMENTPFVADFAELKTPKPAPVVKAESTNWSATSALNTNQSEAQPATIASKESTEWNIPNELNALELAKLSPFGFDQVPVPMLLTYRSNRRFFSVFGELGFSVSEAYRRSDIGHVQALSIGAGLRLTKKNIFWQAGLGLEIEKAKVELSEMTHQYGFGIQTFENRMNYQDMYRATLPLQVGVLLKKHTLQAGATVSYLINAKMKYAYLEDALVKRNETMYGETTGWNSLGLKANVGYGFSLFPSTTIGANFQVQLLNQLNKNWTNDENRFPVAGQLFIRKTIR